MPRREGSQACALRFKEQRMIFIMPFRGLVRFLKGTVIAALAGFMLAIASVLDAMSGLFSKRRPVLQLTRKQRSESITKAV